MFNHSSECATSRPPVFMEPASCLSFTDYIAYCRSLIETRRPDLNQMNDQYERIVAANCPFEYYPLVKTPGLKQGALLIHGLFDSPFTLKEIGLKLQAKGLLTRAILLPGHGTRPSDLLEITYQDWVNAVKYGIETLKQEVDEIYLVGYSTGAALSIYHALHDSDIKGLILLAPAIKIKKPIDRMIHWQAIIKWFSHHRQWVCIENEVDYAKYKSIAFNPIRQVSQLTTEIERLMHQHKLNCKTLIITSHEDETICSQSAMDFFSRLNKEDNRLLLYTAANQSYADKRITIRYIPQLHLPIQHVSHVAIPFSPHNAHYGQQGDYLYASHTDNSDYTYGAYNQVQEKVFNLLSHIGLLAQKRKQLTYNPDFDFMTETIFNFL